MNRHSAPQSLAHRLLIACLAAEPGLAELETLARSGPDWDELFDQALRHEVTPVVHRTLKRLPVAVLPEDERRRWRDLAAVATLRALQMHRELQRLLALLSSHGLAVIPYKGPVLAESAYGDVALRLYNDLDLLVAPDQAWTAVQLLLADGYRLDFEVTPRSWPALRRTINHLFLVHPQQVWGVEVHWALFHAMHVLPDNLAAHWQNLPAGAVGRLGGEESLLTLCAHGTKHLWDRLKWVVDVDRLLRTDPQPAWPELFGQATRMGAGRGLLLGLELARRTCDTPLPEEVLQRIAADPVVAALADDVIARLFPEDPARRDFVFEYLFLLRSRERVGDRIRQVTRWLFCPRQADWQLFPLGARWYPLFYLERPLRMLWKWVVLPGLRRLGG